MDNDIAILILAGGRSSRIGTFKPLIELAGRPLISYVMEFAKFTVDQPYILVSGSDQAKALAQAEGTDDAIFLTDPENCDGPLSAIVSLPKIDGDLIFLMGCDTPFIEPRLPTILRKHIDSSPGAVPIWPNGYLEPLAALYRKESLYRIRSQSPTSFRDVVTRIGAKTLSLDFLGVKPESFFNINTLSDLKKAELMIKKLGVWYKALNE